MHARAQHQQLPMFVSVPDEQSKSANHVNTKPKSSLGWPTVPQGWWGSKGIGKWASQQLSTSVGAAVVAGVLYCISSGALTLLNKKVMVHYNFHGVNALLCFHCTLAALMVRTAHIMGWTSIEPLTMEVVRLWLPVNIIFVAMLATNFYALRTVGVGMVCVCVRGGGGEEWGGGAHEIMGMATKYLVCYLIGSLKTALCAAGCMICFFSGHVVSTVDG